MTKAYIRATHPSPRLSPKAETRVKAAKLAEKAEMMKAKNLLLLITKSPLS